ncbi:MAG TPA: ribosome silencing factor [Nitrospiria bacterium]
MGVSTVDSKEKSLLAAKAALDKKASDLIVFEVGGLTTVADYFIICSAESHRQVRAIRDHIEDALSKHGCHLFSAEGEETGRWILMDYSDLIIHIFKDDVRSFYALERLWGDAPRLDLPLDAEALPPGLPQPAKRLGAAVRRRKAARK